MQSYPMPEWTIAQLLADKRTAWTQSFDKSYGLFAEKLSNAIAADIFTVLREACQDPFKQKPLEKYRLTRRYSFNILDIRQACKLKDMAQEGSQLAPFDEWFAKFANAKRKPEEIAQDSFMQESCSPISTSVLDKIIYQEANEIPIDGSYFAERMALIAKQVHENLTKTFQEFKEHPENQALNISVIWQSKNWDIGSMQICQNIVVELWLKKESEMKLAEMGSPSEMEIYAQVQARRRNQHKTVISLLQAVAITAALIALYKLVLNPTSTA